MSLAPLGPWDRYLAEYGDVLQAVRLEQRRQPCKLCGFPTRALSGICCAHDDLEIALEQTDVLPLPVPQQGPSDGLTPLAGASVSSSATSEPHGLMCIPSGGSPVAAAETRDDGSTAVAASEVALA